MSTSPKVFISYSWSSPSHQERVREWAERLASDGVEVVLDQYDLKDGQDKYAFMERMVTDSTVTHVLTISDRQYSEKADARKAGVGTESQIISKEVYEKVDQSKFIPIFCEFSDSGEPYLPTFLKSRIGINFSSPELVNENWERLIRHLYGKPLYEKPAIGKPPPYIIEDKTAPSSPATAKFNSLKQAIRQGKPGIKIYRNEFLAACIAYADSLRIRERPNIEKLAEKILEDCRGLVHVRNHIIDWVLFESEAQPSEEFTDALVHLFEQLLELKFKPLELSSWNDAWFKANKLFVYETFLYIVAALLRTEDFNALHEVLTCHYHLPEKEASHGKQFACFEHFYAHSDVLNEVLAPTGQRWISPAAELVKRHADREDLPFSSLMEAELLVLLVAFLSQDARWYPQTLLYAGYSHQYPFFVKATRHRDFLKLAKITGVENANALREAVKSGQSRLGVSNWSHFHFDRTFWDAMNMDKLDSLK